MLYVSRLTLKNIRAFRELKLDFTKPGGHAAPRMRTLIIGENSTCKTTLLRSLAIGLSNRADASGLLVEALGQLVSQGKKSGSITIELLPVKGTVEPVIIQTNIENHDGQDILAEKKRPSILPQNLLVCGYGIGRSTEGSESGRAYRIVDSVSNLFQYGQPLVGAELTLRRLRDFLGSRNYLRMMRGIRTVLGLAAQDQIHLPQGGGVTVSGPKIGKAVPLEAWADGYRLTILWLLDLYAWALRANCLTPSGGIRGIVLVDELDQHLHPSLQINMMGRISALLPELQIITTTHSPLVTLGVDPTELVVLTRRAKQVQQQERTPDFTGYSAEDVLVDTHLFNTDVYNPQTNEALTQYRALVSIPKSKRTARQKKELKELTSILSTQQIPEVRESQVALELRTLLQKHGL